MKKSYVTPENEIIVLSMSEGILNNSDFDPDSGIIVDPDNPAPEADTQKKKEIWEGEGNIWG